MSVHPVKTQISLGIRPIWSESLLSAWRNLGPLATHWAHSKDSDQTGQMPWLIRVLAGCTLILLVLSWCGNINSSFRPLVDRVQWHYCSAQKTFHDSGFVSQANLKNMLVCCLPTQNFQDGSVGRKKIFFLLPVQEKDIILMLNCSKIEAKKIFFFRNDQKNVWVGA